MFNKGLAQVERPRGILGSIEGQLYQQHDQSGIIGSQ
jgi:hypothetical protein